MICIYTFIIVLKGINVLFFLIWSNIVVWLYDYWKIIIASTWNFTRGNWLYIYIQVFLKGVWSWGKVYNVVTVKGWVFTVDSTKLTFRDNQLHVSNITIADYCVDLFILYIICSIVNNMNNNPIILRSCNLIVLIIDNSGIYWLICWISNFSILENR